MLISMDAFMVMFYFLLKPFANEVCNITKMGLNNLNHLNNFVLHSPTLKIPFSGL